VPWGRWAQGQRPVPRPLLPARLRPAAAVLLAACVAVTLALALTFAGHTRAGPLDSAVDARARAGLGTHPALLGQLVRLGDTGPVTAVTIALVLACVAVRRWRGGVLVAVAVPATAVLTEFVLKPVIHRTLRGALSFPSGHTAIMFALAVASAVLLADPPGRRGSGAVRLLLVLAALLTAAAVAAAMVGMGFHYFTDTVGGAAVGTALPLLSALVIDGAGRTRRVDEAGASRRTVPPTRLSL
jgi:membrane-associated phospholipid phosphatase